MIRRSQNEVWFPLERLYKIISIISIISAPGRGYCKDSQRQNQLTIPKLLLSTLVIIGHDQRHLKILHRCPNMPLPDHSSIDAIANSFSSFFINKMSIIRSSFCSGSCPSVLKPPDTRTVLQDLTRVIGDEVRRLDPFVYVQVF